MHTQSANIQYQSTKKNQLLWLTYLINVYWCLGPAVPSMAIPDDNNDHITLKHMLLFETVQGSQDLLHDLTQLSDCYNPSVSTYTPPGDRSGPRTRYLLACRSHGNLHGPMTLAWLDPAASFQVDPTTAFMGIGPGKTQVRVTRATSALDHERIYIYMYVFMYVCMYVYMYK